MSNLNGKVLQGANSNYTIGTNISAGLPNIIGNITKTVYKGMLVARKSELTITRAFGVTTTT